MHTLVRALAVVAGFLSAGATVAHAAPAAGYPTRPVRLVVPFAPGGTNDVLGRIVGEKVSERLGQPFVADNRAGANSVVGSEIVARASPDGHTLRIVSAGFEVNGWYGLLAPGKTPRTIVNRLNAELRQVLADPETRGRFQAHGMDPAPGTAEEFTALIRSEIAKWTKVVRAAGIKPE